MRAFTAVAENIFHDSSTNGLSRSLQYKDKNVHRTRD